MKNVYLIFLVFIMVAGVSAQTSNDSSVSASGLLILDKTWRISIPLSELESEDPFRHNNEARRSQQDIKDNMRQNEIRARAGLPALEPPPRRQISRRNTSAPQQPSAVYFYKIKVRNMGEKSIRAIVWEYVFFERETNLEVGRRRSINNVAILPGKTKNLVLRSASPPTGTINATQAGKKLRDRYFEQIVIQDIQYSDGTKWQSGTPSSN